MSTDLYGVRVLALDPEACTMRLRVFVVYYDVAGEYHQPIIDDRTFFVRVLCDKDALDDDIDADGMFDEDYIDNNSFRFVRSFKKLAERNTPVTDYSSFFDFYYERDGCWQDEEKLAQADYDVVVTKPEYLAPFHVGQSWGTTSYQTNSDALEFEDHLHIPDFSQAHTFVPFPDAEQEYSTVDRMLFSPDGSRLLVQNNEGGFGVFETTDWKLTLNRPEQGPWGTGAGWSQDGRPVFFDDDSQLWHVITQGDSSEPYGKPFGPQSNTSGTRFMNSFMEGGLKVLNADAEVLFEMPKDAEYTSFAGFDATGNVCFVSSEQMDMLHRVDLTTGESTQMHEARYNAICCSPDGAYVLASTYGDQGVVVIRAKDNVVVRSLASGYASNHGIYTAVAWSPDGKMCAVSLTNSSGYKSKIMVYHTGQALLEAEHTSVQMPTLSGGIEDIAALFVERTLGFSSGWESHLDDDRMNMHLTLRRVGVEGDLVGHIASDVCKIATRAYESVISSQRGETAHAQRALKQALELLEDADIQDWANTFVFAPLAAAHHLLGNKEEADALLERARVGLDDESNPFQKGAVFGRALLTMGRLDEVRAIIDEAETGWISEFHQRLLIDLIDAKAFDLLAHALETWDVDEDWDLPEIIQRALLNVGAFEYATSLEETMSEMLNEPLRVQAWLRWLEQDLSAASAAFEHALDAAPEDEVLLMVMCWRDEALIPEHTALLEEIDLGQEYMSALLCSMHTELAQKLWLDDNMSDKHMEVVERLQQMNRLDVLAGLDVSLFDEEDHVIWLGSQGRWDEIYEKLNAKSKSERSEYDAMVSVAGRRHDVGVMVDALKQLPCKDMNSEGIDALRSSFKQLANGAYRDVAP